MAVGAPTVSPAWSPCGRLSSRSPNRRCLFSGCAVAAPSPASIDRAPRLVVRKQIVGARASRLTRSRSSFFFAWPMVPRVWSPFYHSSDPNMATD